MMLGILDLGEMPSWDSAEKVIEHTIDSCQIAEQAGFSRFWLAEHHGPNYAWRSPEQLISLLGNYTNKIRLGSAGVLFPLYLPRLVASSYKFLEMILPNRIDLGIAKGAAPLSVIERFLSIEELNKNMIPENHQERVKELIKYLKNDIDNLELILPPYNNKIPAIWMLGTSESNCDFSIENKLNASFSLFHKNSKVTPDLIANYKKKYSKINNAEPVLNIAISGVLGASKNHAMEIVNGSVSNNYLDVNFVGNVDELMLFIDELRKVYKVDEVIFSNFDLNLERRKESLYKLSEKIKI